MDKKQIGTVIKIPNETTIIIHTPEGDLHRGNKVIVYEVLSEIKDLSGNYLGTYDNNKEILEVTENNGEYVIARKVVRKDIVPNIGSSVLKPYIEFEKINVNKDDDENLVEKNNIISIGDLVKRYN